MCVCLTVYVCGTFFLLLGAAWRKKKLDNSLFSPRYFPFFWPLVDFFMTFFCFFFLPCIFPRDLLGKINFLSSYSSSMMKKKNGCVKSLVFLYFIPFNFFVIFFWCFSSTRYISARDFPPSTLVKSFSLDADAREREEDRFGACRRRIFTFFRREKIVEKRWFFFFH